MFVFTGKYRFQRQTIAYRGDFCLSCDCDTVSELQRTFDVFHVYYIPVSPLGFREHWHCMQCSENPHERAKTTRGVKILGVFLFLFVAVFFWLLPINDMDDPGGLWVIRIVSAVGVVFFTALAVLHKPSSSLKEKLGTTPRFSPSNCIACGEPLERASRRCQHCQIEYL